MFLTISYLSNASDELTDHDIQELMNQIRTFNNANDIKGVLVYSDRTFFQVLEGEYEVVNSLYDKIEKDPRHHSLLKIMERKSAKREHVKYTDKFISYNSDKVNQDLSSFLDNNKEKLKDDKLYNSAEYQTEIFQK